MEYYLLESAGTMDWHKQGLFTTLEALHQHLCDEYGFKLEEVVADAEHGYPDYEIKVTQVSVLA